MKAKINILNKIPDELEKEIEILITSAIKRLDYIEQVDLDFRENKEHDNKCDISITFNLKDSLQYAINIYCVTAINRTQYDRFTLNERFYYCLSKMENDIKRL